MRAHILADVKCSTTLDMFVPMKEYRAMPFVGEQLPEQLGPAMPSIVSS
jgi:hypothetical protein